MTKRRLRNSFSSKLATDILLSPIIISVKAAKRSINTPQSKQNIQVPKIITEDKFESLADETMKKNQSTQT